MENFNEKEYIEFLLNSFYKECINGNSEDYIENIYYFIRQAIYRSELPSMVKIDFFDKLKEIKGV